MNCIDRYNIFLIFWLVNLVSQKVYRRFDDDILNIESITGYFGRISRNKLQICKSIGICL